MNQGHIKIFLSALALQTALYCAISKTNKQTHKLNKIRTKNNILQLCACYITVIPTSLASIARELVLGLLLKIIINIVYLYNNVYQFTV